MANDFITLYTRIASELNRTTMTADIKNAINDAITEASKTRFWFNEIKGLTFVTVAAQEYYPDLAVEEVDVLYWFDGQARRNVRVVDNDYMNALAAGSITGGSLINYSRYGANFRLYPIPSGVITVYVDGYGKPVPFPLVADADANCWTASGQGEPYIRALAKSYVLRDKIRDFGEAAVCEALAADRLSDALEKTALRVGTGYLSPTSF